MTQQFNKPRTIDNKRLIGGENSLNTIRIIAAIQVFTTHATGWLQLEKTPFIKMADPLFWGVPIFFILSGFLIWNSLDKTPDYKIYFKKRVLRLYPELWGGLILSLMCIVLLYDGWNIKDLTIYTITQATFFQFWTPDSLRGYGVGNPNGALWAVCTIIQFYVIAFFIKRWIDKHDNLKTWTLLLSVCVMLTVGMRELQAFMPVLLCKLSGIVIFAHLWIFLFGAFLASRASVFIPLLKKYWWLSLCLLFIVAFTGKDISTFRYPLIQTCLIGATWIGFAYAYPRLNIQHDISYGLYIVHMIVINVLVDYNFYGTWLSFGVALAVSILLASVSYMTIGNIVRRRKSKLN